MGSKACINETIEETVRSNLCTGCGTCVALCPVSAIEIIKNEYKGIYIPKLDRHKCNQCGICYKVCPGASVDYRELNIEIFGKEPYDKSIGNYLNCYTAHATDCDIRYNSSSGGLVTAVLIYALEQGIIDGALVTRMKKDKPLEPEPFIARTKDEIIEASGSKYCPVAANLALKEILNVDGNYAVVGLPCHLYGIRKAEMVNIKLKKRIVLHLSIFCSGAPNFNATEFLLSRLNLRCEDLKKLEYRGKGWPGSMSIYLKDGKVEVIPYPEYWHGMISPFYPAKCTECIDWFSKLADISFGDAWLQEIKKDDKIGTSAIISRSIWGDDILQQMLASGTIALCPVDANKIYISQSGLAHKKRQLKVRLTILRLFGQKAPDCDYNHLLEPSQKDYFCSLLIYLQYVLASKRSLWLLLEVYSTLIYFGIRLRCKLRR